MCPKAGFGCLRARVEWIAGPCPLRDKSSAVNWKQASRCAHIQATPIVKAVLEAGSTAPKGIHKESQRVPSG